MGMGHSSVTSWLYRHRQKRNEGLCARLKLGGKLPSVFESVLESVGWSRSNSLGWSRFQSQNSVLESVLHLIVRYITCCQRCSLGSGKSNSFLLTFHIPLSPTFWHHAFQFANFIRARMASKYFLFCGTTEQIFTPCFMAFEAYTW